MISVIIPAYNESETIGDLIKYLLRYGGSDLKEIIVSDGGSDDKTCLYAMSAGAIILHSPQQGRAAQMNFGASEASGDILYFVHADCFPPPTFAKDIDWAIDDGFDFGRFRTKFDSSSLMLKINAWFTRFDLFVCYGGDQTLFMTTSMFKKMHGFAASMKIMEDYDIVVRGKKTGKYKIIQRNVLVSARKYLTNSWMRVQKANYRIIKMYKKGASQKEMTEKYKQLLNYR